MANFARKWSGAEIRKSNRTVDPSVSPDPLHAGRGESFRVGLKPSSEWTRRNPFTGILLPSLLSPREGRSQRPVWPVVRENEVVVTWIGHASFLIQTSAGNVLVDPIWGNWLKGIKRMRLAGVESCDLPRIDLVLVTHAHFDHLDRASLRAVADDQPVVVPFEVGNLVHDLGFGVVQELACWETFEWNSIRVTLTPCHHWGARLLHDSHRGFGGFILEVGDKVVYHCGDTAYFRGFTEIGRRFPIDVALLPIGAYEPPSLRPVHMNPEEAVEAFLELNARVMVPMHFGTFRLSYEPLDEPPKRLLAAARNRGVQDRVVVMNEGSPLVFRDAWHAL